jgi:16S rRNA (guanine527-N7)-methyltransferase
VNGHAFHGAVQQLAGPVGPERLELLDRYAALLAASARRFGLLSTRDEARVAEHIVDSASLLAVEGVDGQLAEGELADLGTGGGLPGIVLAILRPNLEVALVDSRRSRAVFLKQALQELDLKNARVVHERIEHVTRGERFANATAKALGRIEDVLGIALGAVESDGRLFLYKGPAWRDERGAACREAERAGAALEAEHDIGLPDLGRTTTIAVFHVKHRGEPR